MTAPQERPTSDRSLLLLLLLLVPACVFQLAFVWGADLWWYLASGREILAQGGIPDRDVFVYALDPPAPWPTQSWGWTVLLAALHRAFGLAALPVLAAGLVALLVVALFRAARLESDRYGLLNALLVALVVMAGAYRFSLRAELPGWLLLVVFLRRLDRDGPHRTGRGPASRSVRDLRGRGALALLVVLEVLWANLHGSFVLGILAVLCYAPRWAPVVALATFATPGFGVDRLAESAEVARRLLAGVSAGAATGPSALPILEWASPFARGLGLGLQAPLLYVLFLLAGVGSFLVGRRLRWPRALLLVAMALLGAWALRFLVGFGIVAAFVTLRNLVEARPGLRVPRALRSPGFQTLYASALGAVFLLVAAGVWASRGDYEVGQSSGHFFTLNPRNTCPGAADYLVRHGIPGPLFNEMQLGGYLSFRLRPETGERVFIDGRILDTRLLREHGEILVSPERWQAALRRYGFNAVVLSNLAYANLPLRAWLTTARGWTLAYLDPQAALFVRSAGASPPAELVFPAKVPFLGEPDAPAWRRIAARPLLDGTSLPLLETYLSALLQLGQPEAVERYAGEALARGHDTLALHLERGQALLRLGRAREARDELDRAQALAPGDRALARVRQRLRGRAGGAGGGSR